MNSARRDRLRQQIRKVGLRATHARVSVLAHVEDTMRPVTHGEVAEALAASGMDRATVYRNLNDLSEAKLVHRADFGDHVWRYEIAEADAHVHFVCIDCGDVQCLPRDTVTVKSTKSSPRALQRRIEINISGCCDACG
jgi:Fur family ferric uptake transcriptional regulator